MSTSYELVWPLNRWDYLTLPDPVTMPGDENALPAMAPSPGRDLATRALLATACTQERVSALLGVSRRTIGRTVDVDVEAVLRDEAAVTVARTCLADIESRGGTAEEQDAASAWLDEQARPPAEQSLGPPPQPASAPVNGTAVAAAVPRRRPQAKTAKQIRLAVQSPSVGSNGRSRASAARVRSTVKPALQPELQAASSPGVGLGPEQVHALTQQQERILHRSLVLACAVKVETPDVVTLRAALADLLADIVEAARACIVTLNCNAQRP